MLDKHLKYDFPKGNRDPFDVDFNGNYFAYANAFSNLGKDLSEFTIEILEHNIPMGYKTIVLCYRVALVKNGSIEKQWDENNITPEISLERKYFLTSNKEIKFYREDWKNNIVTNVIIKPESKDASLRAMEWLNLDQSIEHAKIKTKENGSSILISRIVESISWH